MVCVLPVFDTVNNKDIMSEIYIKQRRKLLIEKTGILKSKSRVVRNALHKIKFNTNPDRPRSELEQQYSPYPFNYNREEGDMFMKPLNSNSNTPHRHQNIGKIFYI